jgi:hypothetical protein
VSYDLEVKGGEGDFRFEKIRFNVFCPPEPLAGGSYAWRYRFHDRKGKTSPWSRKRAFTVAKEAKSFPLPAREELLSRIPKGHPRLFLRPEDLPPLRALAEGEKKASFHKLVQQCERLLRKPPPTEEPPKYPKGMVRKSEAWRKMWWGNRVYTIKVLDSAATLAFVTLMGGKDEYRDLAKRLLLEAAKWDPHGATGYRYNDEAGMPYAYHFSRAYTFLYDSLSGEERETCRRVMRERGGAMYRHLCPRHLGYPYSSHSNRAWHFLGEVGIAFHGEIPEAADWIWFAANVFRCVYPVWCDDDGGWHEGMCYWRSYIGRFAWWAAVMKSALALDAYKKPYFSKVGYYPLYMQPPGQRGGGFGDLCARQVSKGNVLLMAIFAAQARNPHWQWYVKAHGGSPVFPGFAGFIGESLPPPNPKTPGDLPTSRLFRGTGQAVLNVTLLDAAKNVQVLFKSSPFGSQSHGYEAQNAFLLNVFGERLLIRSGYRDIYGSAHHRMWMWETKSVNSITVDGKGQAKHTSRAKGEILEFRAGRRIDYVSGEAGRTYGGRLNAFTRRILFLKPDLILLFDTLNAPKASLFDWHMHAPYPMEIKDPASVVVEGKKSAARIAFLAPEGLKVSQTDRFDPPPRPRVKLREWHLTASTPVARTSVTFVTAIRPYRKGAPPPTLPECMALAAGTILQCDVPEGRAVILLRTGEGKLALEGFTTKRRVAARIVGAGGKEVARFESEEGLEEGF